MVIVNYSGFKPTKSQIEMAAQKGREYWKKR